MNPFKRFKIRSIRGKLMLGSSGLVFLVALSIFVYFPTVLKRESLRGTTENVKNISEIVTFSFGPALFFDDRSGIAEVFASVRQNKDLVYVVVSDKSGRAVQTLNERLAPEPSASDSEGIPFTSPDGRTMNVSRRVMQGGKQIGSVRLGFSLARMQAEVESARGAVALISLLVLVFGVFISLGMSVTITNPLSHLAETADEISRGDLTRRSQISSDDEVGRLSRSFNTMVSKVDTARRELEMLNLNLEKRVLLRTQDLLHEITERKLIEKELMAEKERAELASRTKSDFLANMSHELRTPLNAVIGFAQVLGDEYFGQLNPKQREYVKDIQSSGEHLLGLINDILDIAKIEARKMEIELSWIHLRDLLEHSLIMIKEKCARHRIALRLEIEPGINGLDILADARKLKQVIFNLLSNASKFTPEGGLISLEARRNEAKITISVRDTGIGVDPAFHEKIFEEFYQVKSGTTDKTPGTGLGLSLCRRIVGVLGGRLWIESEGLSKGSRFSFELPILGPGKRPGPEGAEGSCRGKAS